MPRKVERAVYDNEVVIVRTRRGTVYAYLTIKKERKTLRIACPAFDFMSSVLVAERRIQEMYPGRFVLFDKIQVERGVAFGGFD